MVGANTGYGVGNDQFVLRTEVELGNTDREFSNSTKVRVEPNRKVREVLTRG